MTVLPVFPLLHVLVLDGLLTYNNEKIWIGISWKLGFEASMDDRTKLRLSFTLSGINISLLSWKEKSGSLVLSLSKTITFRASKEGNKYGGYSPTPQCICDISKLWYQYIGSSFTICFGYITVTLKKWPDKIELLDLGLHITLHLDFGPPNWTMFFIPSCSSCCYCYCCCSYCCCCCCPEESQGARGSCIGGTEGHPGGAWRRWSSEDRQQAPWMWPQGCWTTAGHARSPMKGRSSGMTPHQPSSSWRSLLLPEVKGSTSGQGP